MDSSSLVKSYILPSIFVNTYYKCFVLFFDTQVLVPISNSSTYFYHLIFLLFLSHDKTGNALLNYWHNL